MEKTPSLSAGPLPILILLIFVDVILHAADIHHNY